MKLRKLDLEEHHRVLYEILFAIDDFCKEYNIRYCLAYGTLLGADRHHGIIPWDDDIDIYMEREEYERFEELFKKHPVKGYTLNSIHTTKGYYYPFIKFSKDGTYVKEPFKYVPPIGINIDVFPLDGCPSQTIDDARDYSWRLRNEVWESLHYWTDLRWKNFHGVKGKIAFLLFSIPFFKRRKLLQHYDKCSKWPISQSAFVTNCAWSFSEGRDVYAKELMADTINCKFGERKVPIPIGYDVVLSSMYGDYMTPPPENERVSTHQTSGVFVIV